LSDKARAGGSCAEELDALDELLAVSKLDYLLQQIPRAIQQSLEGMGQVSSIVKAMKEFSHPSGGEKQPMDLHEVIESTSLVARNEWKYVADLELDFDWSLPPVPILRNEISQVFLNLIVNAAHAIAAATPDGVSEKGKITIGTRAVAAGVEIRVTDSGQGIPQAIQGRIFEPFFTTKEVGKGTGQGLAIAYSVVVEKHHGTIAFESEEGRGTVFILTLPLSTPEQGMEATA
jgi:two-component system, NtrC family, sensor kinase